MTKSLMLVEILRREGSDSHVDVVAQGYHNDAADRIAELEAVLKYLWQHLHSARSDARTLMAVASTNPERVAAEVRIRQIDSIIAKIDRVMAPDGKMIESSAQQSTET